MAEGPMFQFEGRRVLITGSTRGIGKALAEGFASAGAFVYVHGRDAGQGDGIAEAIGGRYVEADLADEAAVRRLAERIDRLDVLLNNAGLETLMPIDALDFEVFDRIQRVNVRAPVLLAHLLLDKLAASRSGSIINVTSIHDTMPYPYNSAYSMSKAALAMFTKAAAVELAPRGIRVNNLAPGAVETDINRAVIDRIGRDCFARWIPAGRVGQVHEMVGPALFLASDAASYITGATLYADGGYLQHLVRYRPNSSEAE